MLLNVVLKLYYQFTSIIKKYFLSFFYLFLFFCLPHSGQDCNTSTLANLAANLDQKCSIKLHKMYKTASDLHTLSNIETVIVLKYWKKTWTHLAQMFSVLSRPNKHIGERTDYNLEIE